jgi:hypothetical protein
MLRVEASRGSHRDSIADEVIEGTSRSATIDGREVSLWVNRGISGLELDFRLTPNSDQIATLWQPTLGPDLPIGA